MRPILAILLLSVVAEAQTPPAQQCGGSVCVGSSGQPVSLGNTVGVDQGPWPDGGVARVMPLTTGVPLSLLGNQSRTSTLPDVIIGAVNARDGGMPLVSFRTNSAEVANISPAGILTVKGVTNSGTATSALGKFDLIDAGNVNVQGVTSTGSLTVNALSFTPRGRGTLAYDFPSLGGTMAPLNTYCATSFTGAATGCAFGDSVLLGIDQVLLQNGTINAYVSAADSFTVIACATGIVDAGSFNMPDASYTVTCVR